MRTCHSSIFNRSRNFGQLLVDVFEQSPRAVALVCIAAVSGEFVFRMVPWDALQMLLCSTLVRAGALQGTELISNTTYRFAGYAYEMTPRCTYADFFCLTAPFILRFRSLNIDALRLCCWVIGITVLVFARVYAACSIRPWGVPWWLGHDTVDYALRIVLLLAVIYHWLAFWRNRIRYKA